jgi:uncharacterized FlaG/YvyC family protein
MSSALSLPPNATVHQEDAVNGMKAHKLPTLKASAAAAAPAKAKAAEPKLAPEFNFKADSMAMSFAYVSVAHSLNIVMTDKASGEVIRKITYKHMSSDVHQTRMLQGLLLDQQA